jgi:ketosteroid isomerase-like protein
MNRKSGENMSASATEQAEKLLTLWAAAFAENSPAAMALLYQDGSMLYGSKAELFEGIEGAMRYFSGLAPRRSRAAQFTEVTASFAGDAVIAMAATATFVVSDAPPLVTRFTQTWVKTGEEWRVLSHHASPKKAFPV